VIHGVIDAVASAMCGVAQAYFKRLCKLTQQARRTYQDIVAALEQEARHDDQAASSSNSKFSDKLAQCKNLTTNNSDKLTDGNVT